AGESRGVESVVTGPAADDGSPDAIENEIGAVGACQTGIRQGGIGIGGRHDLIKSPAAIQGRTTGPAGDVKRIVGWAARERSLPDRTHADGFAVGKLKAGVAKGKIDVRGDRDAVATGTADEHQWTVDCLFGPRGCG